MSNRRESEKIDGEPERQEGTPEVDVGGVFKSFGLGGLINGISDLVEKAGELAKKGEKLQKAGKFRVKGIPPGAKGGEKLKGMYGFTISTLAGGQQKVDTFGNIKKTPEGPVVEEVREPMVDVFDEAETVKVIAEMPGVEQSKIHIEIEGDILSISAEGEERKYSKEVLLPAEVEEETADSSYENGILEVELRKKQN